MIHGAHRRISERDYRQIRWTHSPSCTRTRSSLKFVLAQIHGHCPGQRTLSNPATTMRVIIKKQTISNRVVSSIIIIDIKKKECIEHMTTMKKKVEISGCMFNLIWWDFIWTIKIYGSQYVTFSTLYRVDGLSPSIWSTMMMVFQYTYDVRYVHSSRQFRDVIEWKLHDVSS